MHALPLHSILASMEGLLLGPSDLGDHASLVQSVHGIELHQPEAQIAYDGKLVLVTNSVQQKEEVEALRAQCQTAVALILPSGTPAAIMTGATIPLLLRRSPWTTTDALMRALSVLFYSSAIPSKSDSTAMLQREASLAIHRQESALLSLLRGTTDPGIPAALLGLRPDLDHVVLAAGVDAKDIEAYRLAVSAEFPNERSVESEQIVFTIVSIDIASKGRLPVVRLRSRLGRAFRSARDLPIGVGPNVPGVFAIHESASAAREVLRAMRLKLGIQWPAGEVGVRVAGAEDVPDALALIRAGDALRSQGPMLASPLMVVAEYDREHGSDLLPSVLAALEYRGNTADAARRLGIHANSLRARLDRVREISGIDLNDPVSAMRATIAFLAHPPVHNISRRTL